MGDYGSKSDRSRVTRFLPQHMTKGCSVCGAVKGSRCRTTTGAILTTTHSDRAKAVRDAEAMTMTIYCKGKAEHEPRTSIDKDSFYN